MYALISHLLTWLFSELVLDDQSALRGPAHPYGRACAGQSEGYDPVAESRRVLGGFPVPAGIADESGEEVRNLVDQRIFHSTLHILSVFLSQISQSFHVSVAL